MNKIRVLVVDDSAFMRKLISDFLNEDKTIEVIGTARNGKDAISKVELLNPDVITMDIEMPVMNGLDALKIIMNKYPRPVIMLSSTTKSGTENTIRSLHYGALDFIAKPSGSISLDLFMVKEELNKKVKSAKSANVLKMKGVDEEYNPLNRTTYSKIDTYREKIPPKTKNNNLVDKLVCIGTSTGGPRALQQVLPVLPGDIDAPIFVVQHMPPGFTKSLANRLDSLSKIHVKEAVDGEQVQKATAYIAPGGFHLRIVKSPNGLKVQLDKSETKNGHRPSVDVMFESLSDIQNYHKIAVIMTGMGSDGTEGLKKLKSTGVVDAITESEDSSVVYGMPKSAYNTKLVDKVVHLENIAASIMDFIRN